MLSLPQHVPYYRLFKIDKVIGEGSFGKALLCRRKDDYKRCIIKLISLGHLSPKEARQTQQEASLLERLNHPNIVSFWDSFVIGPNLFIVMEFADGGDLDQFLRRRKGNYMSEGEVLQLFVQISLAIKHTHDRKVLHRDLKPGNIFLTRSGLVKLGDFGVSKVLKNTGEFAVTQIGTPYYMSPEIMDNKRYNSKTDIWSLGCILYEIICLRLPFDGNSMAQLCQNIQTGNGAVISSSLHYSESLKELVKDMLQRNSTLRPGINAILSRPVVKVRISCFLDASVKCKEFSHTVIHGMNILSAPAADQQSRNMESITGGSSNQDKVRICDTRNDGERVRRERDGQMPTKMVIKLDDDYPAVHNAKKREAVEKEVREIQERREEILLREGLQRHKIQIENGKKDKIVGKLPSNSRSESEKEREDRQKVDAEIRRRNEKAMALAAQQALERRRALEDQQVSRRQARDEAAQPQVSAREATEKRGVLLRQDRSGNDNVNRESESVPADHVLSPPPGNPTTFHRPSEIARARKEDDVNAADKKNIKARENLLRFERDRLERHAKLEKKAIDRDRLQKLRQNEIFVMPSAKQHEPISVPLPLPQPPKQSSKAESRKERIIESEIRRVVPPVNMKHDACADPTAEDASPDSVNVPVKTSSVETAAILRKHDSFMKTRGPAALVASSAGVDDSPVSANYQQHDTKYTPRSPKPAAEDESNGMTAAGSDASDFHVSPFIFSGSVVPWRCGNPAENARGSDAANDQRIEFSVDVAVEYSELFAQMQEVLEDEDYRTAGASPKNIPHRSASDGDSDETFGDEDNDDEDPLNVPDDA